MTFEEAMDRLNHHDIAGVAAEMVEWHPVILGAMLLAVAAAKKVRYEGDHPDYTGPAAQVLKSAVWKMTPGQAVKQNTRHWANVIKLAVERLNKWLESQRGM